MLTWGLVSIAFALNAQVYEDPANGNVGVGTQSPAAKLHIGQGNREIRFDYDGTNNHYGSLRWAGLQLGNNGSNRIVAGRSVAGGLLDFYVNNTNDGANYDIGPNGILAMRINHDGNVGIGTSTPSANLEIRGNGLRLKLSDTGPEQETNITYSTTSYGIWQTGVNNTGGGSWWVYQSGYGYLMNFLSNGNVGIGTTTPKEKLSVNGKIRAHEIKVETANWPDYVFTKDYQLLPLQQTEQHIKEKGHLPGIPSAAEVKANGIDLGEMNAKLLQKIEELTLHLIEQNKRLSAQEKEINKLKNN